MRVTKAAIVTAVVLALALGPVAMAQGECRAKLNVKYRGPEEKAGSEFVDHIFGAEVETDADCGKVAYVLEVKERYPDGETRIKTKQFVQQVNRGTDKVRKIKYRLHRNTRVDGHEFRVTGCSLCGAPR